MGNRAAVLFGDERAEKADGDGYVGVYLHWNGGPESVYAFTKLLASYAQSQRPEAKTVSQYPTAMASRFVQMVANYFASSGSDFSSIHVEPNPGTPLKCNLDTEHGVYVIRSDFSVDRFGGNMVDRNGDPRRWTDEERIDEFKQVLGHEYWKNRALEHDLRGINDLVFLRKFSMEKDRLTHDFVDYALPIERELERGAECAPSKKASLLLVASR